MKNQTIAKHFEAHIKKTKCEKQKYHLKLNMLHCDAIPSHWEYVQQEAIKIHAGDFIRWSNPIKTAECASIVFYQMIDIISIDDTDANWETFLQYTPLVSNKQTHN